MDKIEPGADKDEAQKLFDVCMTTLSFDTKNYEEKVAKQNEMHLAKNKTKIDKLKSCKEWKMLRNTVDKKYNANAIKKYKSIIKKVKKGLDPIEPWKEPKDVAKIEKAVKKAEEKKKEADR